jgi:hypothetical protein
MRDAGMDDIISKPFKVEDLVKRIKSIILEDGSAKKEKESHPPATNVSDNKEVRMLEDVPIRSRSEISGKGGKKMETGGEARIELNGEEQKGNESRPESEGRKKSGEQSQEHEEERDRREVVKGPGQDKHDKMSQLGHFNTGFG